jgi:uncharacterized membrane protein
MDRKAFISELEKNLKVQGVSDIEGIIEEYEDHFRFKMADGYSEEEIAARLGNPKEVAAQYLPAATAIRRSGGSKAVIAIGLVFADIFAVMLFVLFFAWVAVLGAVAVACATLGVALIANFNVVSLIPVMPYLGAAIMGIAFLALAILSGLGTFYCWRYAAWLTSTYYRWHKRCLSSDPGKHLAVEIPGSQLSPRTRRILRRLTGIAVLVFGAAFILGYIIMALQAGAIEFWHAWSWFI